MSIFDDMSADRGWTPEPPAPIPAAILGVEDTQWVPIVTPARGENDHLIERTDNGLRPDDLALRQPPQDPRWRVGIHASHPSMSGGAAMLDELYTDPATTWLPQSRYDDPAQNPIAYLPVHAAAEALTYVTPRIDDWCEDRSPSELTDLDGVD